jgi:uncharacterized protein (TIGR04255 family)
MRTFVPQYSKAPITEAVIDLSVRLPKGVTLQQLRVVQARRASTYPVEGKFGLATLRDADSFDEMSVDRDIHGIAMKSDDGARIGVAKLDGFMFVRLPPYDHWASFRDEAHSLWQTYREVAKPEAITKVSLKYVNRFDLPLPVKDFAVYFRTYPEVSSALPQSVSGFFTQLQIPYEDLGAMLVLTQTIVPPPQSGFASVVLDIDLSVPNNPSSDDDDVWELLARLRDRKNEVFEGCITDAARELIR